MKLEFTNAALRTDPVTEALATGIVTLIDTGSFRTALDSMVLKGMQNGAVSLIKLGLVIDVTVAIGQALE